MASEGKRWKQRRAGKAARQGIKTNCILVTRVSIATQVHTFLKCTWAPWHNIQKYESQKQNSRNHKELIVRKCTLMSFPEVQEPGKCTWKY